MVGKREGAEVAAPLFAARSAVAGRRGAIAANEVAVVADVIDLEQIGLADLAGFWVEAG